MITRSVSSPEVGPRQRNRPADADVVWSAVVAQGEFAVAVDVVFADAQFDSKASFELEVV